MDSQSKLKIKICKSEQHHHFTESPKEKPLKEEDFSQSVIANNETHVETME